jgi:hypothetical protein
MEQVSKNQLVIEGYSDDNLEFRGSIHDEVGCWDEEPIIQLPDGSEIKFEYTGNGKWEAELLKQGSYPAIKIDKYDDDTNDVVTIDAEVPYLFFADSEGIRLVGQVELNDEQKAMYRQLKELFDDVDEFIEKSEAVKVILKGVKIF